MTDTATDTRTDADLPAVGESCHRALGAEVRTVAEDGRAVRSTFTFMTGDLARDGMVVDPAGVDVANYLRNPVVLWEHGYDFARGGVPVGRAVSVSRVENGWAAEVEWEEDEFAQRIAGMVQRGTLSAVSFGWRTLAREWQTLDNGQEVMVVTRSEMMEFSVVSVPADAGALVTERAEGAAMAQLIQLLRTQGEALSALRSEIADVRTALDAPVGEGTSPSVTVDPAMTAPEAEPAPDLNSTPETEPAPDAPTADPADDTPAGEGTSPVAPRAATPEETARAFAALLPDLELAYERQMGRA